MTPKKKKILVLPQWYPNETDVQLGIFIRRQAILMAEVYDIHIIYVHGLIDAKENYRLETKRDNGLLETTVYYKQSVGKVKRLNNLKRIIQAQKMAYASQKFVPDLIHVQVPYRSGFLATKLLKSDRIPFVITEHWSGHINEKYNALSRTHQRFYLRLFKKATRISTVSHVLQQAVKKNTGFDSVVIPNYIESRQIQEEHEAVNGKIRMLSVGDFDDKTKNITGLLQAYKLALKTKPNLHLTLIGGGPDEALIHSEIDRLGLTNDQLNVLGRQDHETVLIEMQKTNFYICNSRFETFGMTVAEALLSGKPVISTPCGGPESFLSESNSLLLSTSKSDHKEELSAAIVEMSTLFNSYNTHTIQEEITMRFGRDAVQNAWINFYSI